MSGGGDWWFCLVPPPKKKTYTTVIEEQQTIEHAPFCNVLVISLGDRNARKVRRRNEVLNLLGFPKSFGCTLGTGCPTRLIPAEKVRASEHTTCPSAT